MQDRPSAGDYIKRLQQDAPQMFKENVELAKAEVKPAAKAAGMGAGMFGGAGFFAIRGLAFLFYAAVFAIAMIFNQVVGKSALTSLTLAFLIVGVLILILGAVLALLGKGQFKKVKTPQATIDEFKNNIQALSTGFSRGRDEVTADLAEREALKTTKKLADRKAAREHAAQAETAQSKKAEAYERKFANLTPAQGSHATTIDGR